MPVQSPRILVLEDEFAIAEEIAHHLREEGFDVLTANTPKAAINFYETSVRSLSPALAIHLVLLDVRMVGDSIDGIEVAKKIFEIREVPIFFLTAYSKNEDYEARVRQVPHLGWFDKAEISVEQIRKTIERSLAHDVTYEQADLFPGFKDRIALKPTGQSDFRFIEINQIQYIESIRNGIVIYLTDGSDIVFGGGLAGFLQAFEKQLDGTRHSFLRVLNKYVVNVNHIESFNKDSGHIRIKGRGQLTVHSTVTSFILSNYIIKTRG